MEAVVIELVEEGVVMLGRELESRVRVGVEELGVEGVSELSLEVTGVFGVVLEGVALGHHVAG